ncbi:MAG: hypothetical protein AAGI44_07310, partial [Pseudomonadota bacterium]
MINYRTKKYKRNSGISMKSFNTSQKALVLVCLTVGAAGCSSSLNVTKIENEPTSGVVYTLPFTQFDIEILRRVSSCDGEKMKVATKASFKPRLAPDLDQIYAIDVTSMSRLFNHASTEVALHAGTTHLKTINAEAQDKSLEVAASVVKTVVGIATVAAGAGGPAAVCYDPVDPDQPGTAELLKAAKDQEKRVADVTGELNELTLNLASKVSEIADLKPATDPALEKERLELLQKLKSKKILLELEEKKLAKALSPISHTDKLTWPQTGDQFSSATPSTLPMATLIKWVGKNSADASQLRAFDVYFALERVGGYGRDPLVVIEPPVNPGEGQVDVQTPPDQNETEPLSSSLQYRIPVAGRIVACKVAQCSSDDLSNLIGKSDTSLAQLGHVNSLPIKTKAFESAKFSAEWTKDGYL